MEPGLRPGVAVGVDRKYEPAEIVDERVVDAPGVDADRGELRALRERRDGLRKTGLHFLPERAEIPIIVAAQRVEGIRETVDLAERQPVSGPRPENDAAAGGSKIDGGGVNGGGHGESTSKKRIGLASVTAISAWHGPPGPRNAFGPRFTGRETRATR